MNAFRSTLNALSLLEVWHGAIRESCGMLEAIISAGLLNKQPVHEVGMPRRRIRKYTRPATRVLLIVAAVVIAFILLMVFALGW